jgi:hypothetical protein
MAEQTINFQNGQRHPHKFRVSGLNSLSRQIPMEPSLDEVPGANWHGMGGQADQRAEKQLHNARSKLNMSKFNILSRFAREAELCASIVHQLNQPLCGFRSMWAVIPLACGHLKRCDVGSDSVAMWAAFFDLA